MTDEAKLEVTLDTEKAKKELDKLKKEAAKRAREAAGAIMSGLSRGFEFVGVSGGGAMIGQALRGPTQQAYSGIINESFGAYGKAIQRFVLGDHGIDAKAGEAAREQTIQAFRMTAGINNNIPPGAREYFTQMKALRTLEEKGTARFEEDPFFRGVQPADLYQRFMTGIGEQLGKAADYLVNKLNPFSSR
jgi:hypothetical protein